MMSILLGILLNPLVLLLLGVGAWVYMKRHENDGMTTGQRFLRGVWISLLVLCTAGFGLCGGFGLVGGLVSMGGSGESAAYGGMFAIVGGIGVAIALVTGWLLRRALGATPTTASVVDEAGDLSPFSPAAEEHRDDAR